MLIIYCYIKCVDKERNRRSITVCITNTKAAKRATASPDLIAAHALPVSSFFIHPNRTDTSLQGTSDHTERVCINVFGMD